MATQPYTYIYIYVYRDREREREREMTANDRDANMNPNKMKEQLGKRGKEQPLSRPNRKQKHQMNKDGRLVGPMGRAAVLEIRSKGNGGSFFTHSWSFFAYG